jgi:hypothetical protein
MPHGLCFAIGRNHNHIQGLAKQQRDDVADVPDRFELFILGDDEKKVTSTQDTRTSPTCLSLPNNKLYEALTKMIRCT